MTMATQPARWLAAGDDGRLRQRRSDALFLVRSAEPEGTEPGAGQRLSLAIDHDVTDPMAIRGLSMAARAYPVSDPAEMSRMLEMLVTKYPEYAFPKPKPEKILIFQVVPEVVSVLDYSKGFGHTDLVML